MEEPITVLLVDDHSVVRIGLKAYFATLPDIQVIGEASSGDEAVQLAAQYAPDVVVMDLMMPGTDGVEATRKVKKTSPRTQVIVLTSYHDDEHIFPAIRAGALSYLLKDIDPDDLADAIRRARVGEATLNPRVAARMVQELHGTQDITPNPFRELTDRELDVLRLIAAGKSNHDIAELLVISEKTVKSHITNILNKLHLGDRTQAAVFAWQEGIVRRNNRR
ncbi:MAG: DNA-binding response regulator [Chloroflexi bacterium]|nr:MAG: DNA-binding response regulator [Chloroflexota bacterium]